MTSVDDAQASSGAEFGPIGGSGEPIKIFAQEGINGGAAVHDGVCKYHSLGFELEIKTNLFHFTVFGPLR